MSCYKLYLAFDWFVMNLVIYLGPNKSHALIKLKWLHKQRIVPLIMHCKNLLCFSHANSSGIGYSKSFTASVKELISDNICDQA